MLPNLIIDGFPKCGTTSLFKWLADHPHIVGSTVKETNYFIDAGTHSFDGAASFASHGLPGYEAFFPHTSDARIVLEATPQDVYQKTALAVLPDLASRPQFIFILREPSQQILSSYRYYRSNFNFLDPVIGFADFVELVRLGDPSIGSELIRDAMTIATTNTGLSAGPTAPVGNMLVYLFEDITADARNFVKRVAGDIGIDPSFYDDYVFSVENYSYNLRSYALHQINIRIREMLPIPQRSRLWRGLRAFYRRLNILPGTDPLTGADREALEALKREWEARYRRLASHYRGGAGAIRPASPKDAAGAAANG